VWTGIKQLPTKVPSLISAIGGAKRDVNSPMSVVGVSRLGGEAVQQSQWALFWLLLATLQFFLGVFNLLPFVPLGTVATSPWRCTSGSGTGCVSYVAVGRRSGRTTPSSRR